MYAILFLEIWLHQINVSERSHNWYTLTGLNLRLSRLSTLFPEVVKKFHHLNVHNDCVYRRGI